MSKPELINREPKVISEGSLKRMVQEVADLGSGQRRPTTVEYRREGPVFSVNLVRPDEKGNKPRTE